MEILSKILHRTQCLQGLFLIAYLKESLGWDGTVFEYFSSGLSFNLFLRFKRSQGWNGNFLMYSISLLWFLLPCINFFFDTICKYFFSERLSLSLGCKGVFLKNSTSSSSLLSSFITTLCTVYITSISSFSSSLIFWGFRTGTRSVTEASLL